MTRHRSPLIEDHSGQLRRRVQAFLQVQEQGPYTAAGLANRLEAPVEQVQAVLDDLAAAGAVVPRLDDASRPIYVPSVRQRRLGELLVESELITPAQLEEALAEQAKTGERLGQIVINRGFITKQALGEALQTQRGTPYINLATHPIDEGLLRSIPASTVTEYKVVPFARQGREVHVAMVDPTDVVAIDHVAALLRARVRPFLTTEQDFDWAVTRFFDVAAEVGKTLREAAPQEVEEKPLVALTVGRGPDDHPIVRVLNTIIQDAVRVGATDIHLEPEMDQALIRFRVDGLLLEKTVLPASVATAVASRLKVLAAMDIAERVRPQDGRILLDLEGREYDLRVATVGTAFGERVAIRILKTQQVLLGMERLGLFPEQQEILKRQLAHAHGMVLVTGPTGSGKTTTLYAAVDHINERIRNIMTIEDPVEYRLSGITQIPVREKAGITFGVGLRAILRQDPDVVMVGEIRDTETASIAVHAALTGHLVLTTLHTSNAGGALIRLLDMGIEPYLLTSSILAVVGQRLMRILCTTCKRPYAERRQANLEVLGLEADASPMLFVAEGCPECAGLGYKGRSGIFEIMTITDRIRELVLSRRPAAVLMEAARAEGMQTVRQAATRKVLEGVAGLDELRRLIMADPG